MHARNGFRRKIFLSFPQASTDHVHTMLSNFRERLPLQRDGMIRDVERACFVLGPTTAADYLASRKSKKK
jgi:hypothetical protein